MTRITVAKGDGIGPEIMGATLAISSVAYSSEKDIKYCESWIKVFTE